MKRFGTRLCAAALCLCLWAGAALADIPSLDDTLSAYFDANQDVRLSLRLELQNLPPFTQDTLDMFNGVLKHLSVNAEMNGEDTAMTFAADGAGLFSLSEQRKDGLYRLTSELLPNRILTSAGDGLEALFPSTGGEEKAFDLSLAAAQAEACYQALTDAILPYAEEKKANYKIPDVGYAKWVRLARLTPEQSAELLPQMINLLSSGMDAAFREELQGMTCKKGFTVALYQDKEGGADIAVYMKGNVSLGEDDSRTLAYQWAFLRQEGKRKDTYKLELIRSQRPAKQRVIEASRSNTDDGGKLAQSLKSAVTLKNGADVTTATEKSSLKGKRSDGTVSLSGTMTSTVKTTLGDQTETVETALTPNLTLTSAEGSGVLSGSVGYAETRGKAPGLAFTVTLDEEPARALTKAAEDGALYAVADEPESAGEVTITIGGSSLTQNLDEVKELTGEPTDEYLVGQAPQGLQTFAVPATPLTVSLDDATAEEEDALRQEACQNAASFFLKALIGLDGEDGALFRDNMTDGDFASLLTILSELK